MKMPFRYTVFICLLIGSIDAQICPQNFSIHTAMQCNRCTGELQMDFRPYGRVNYLEDAERREINCTVNKPSNISIFFNHLWKPVAQEPTELSTNRNVWYIKLNKLNGGCTYTIKFPKSSSLATICSIGMFTCKAVTDANETISKTQRVDGNYAIGGPPFTFKVEDPDLQKTKELIIGTSANLSCSFNIPKSVPWKPQIIFRNLSSDGVTTLISESFGTPRRLETQGYIDKVPHSKHFTYIRRLFLRHINADANTTFLCKVTPFRGGDCQIEKKLKLRTRPCKAGYYCNPNSSKELPCKEGTYSNITGLFDKSGCKTCPLNAYCPSGSPLPIPCPASNFLPARRTKIKIFEGKISEDECRWCPVDPCDENAVQCTFICGSTRFKGIVGKSVSVRCLLSDRSLMRNLSWYKGNKKIIGSASYKIENRNKEFVLTIHKLSLKDAGDYVCSGFDMIMGNQFNNTVHLDLKNSRKISHILFSLLISGGVLLIVVCGLLVWIYWRRHISQSSNEDEDGGFVNDADTLLVSKTLQHDS